MERILVFDGSLISVWAYPWKGLIHHQMKTYCHGEEFREALGKGSAALELHKATKWLSDNRATGPLPPEDELWAAQHWFPRTRAAGWKHWAMVQPMKILTQLNLTRIVNRYAELGINARVFGDLDEASQWLDAI
jgi:hypothetical protein